MKYNKWLGSIGILAVCMTLTGCHSHEWQEATCTMPKTCLTGGETEGEALGHAWAEATCTEPKTCSVCGETEGEALGHSWIEANCTEPKTCSVCGETEGKALEHTLTEANYQQASICKVCGETVGEPIQADFEKNNFTYVTELDKEYPFTTKCYASNDLTNGKIIFSNYRTFTSDDEHEAQEGYEWKTVIVTIVFDDENADKYGMGGYACVSGDFYDMIPNDEVDNEDFFTVVYNGIDFTECKEESEWLTSADETWIKKEDGTLYYKTQLEYSCRIPVGYDGRVISIYNYDIDQKIGDSVETKEDVMLYMGDENTITFRLK